MNNTEFYEKILQNKPELKHKLNCLDKVFEGKFNNALAKENDAVNTLSIFSEIKFGYHLLSVFGNESIQYEPKINNKRPDWLVQANNQNIIFEVKLINEREEILKNRIDVAKEGYYTRRPTYYVESYSKFRPHLSKIKCKAEKYRQLITENNYVLVICIDVIGLSDNLITADDLKAYLNFDDLFFRKDVEMDFIDNVAGILAYPNFIEKGILFIDNRKSKFGLNDKNKKIVEENG